MQPNDNILVSYRETIETLRIELWALSELQDMTILMLRVDL